ncbi:MAG: hypothetical protein WDM92_06870 [Caulobacteraceae bacterium]
MNIQAKLSRAAIVRPASRTAPRRPVGAIHAVWAREPRTGRLVQTWRADADDADRSCTARPGGPRSIRPSEGGAFARAA